MINLIMNFIDKSNKVLLFIAATFVIIAIGKDMISDLLRQDYSEPRVQVIDDSDAKMAKQKPILEKRYIGQIKDVHILELTSDKVLTTSSYSPNADMMIVSSSFSLSSNAVNLMFTKTGEINTLLFKTNALIVSFSPTLSKETEYHNSLSKNIYSVAKKDTNQDGFLNKDDKKTLMVSEYDGSMLKVVMDNIEGYQVINNDVILLYIKTGNDTSYYTYEVVPGKLNKLDTSLPLTSNDG